MPKRASGPATVYQLKITLKDLKPPVWRRIQVEDCSLARLHGVIQACMGWSNCHLYAFELDGEEYGDDPDLLDARSLKLGRIARDGPSRFTYQYDFGDDWRHVVNIEKTLPAEPGASYPRCMDGKRACPPRTAAGPTATRTFWKPSGTRAIRSTNRCSTGWAAVSIQRHSTSRARTAACDDEARGLLVEGKRTMYEDDSIWTRKGDGSAGVGVGPCHREPGVHRLDQMVRILTTRPCNARQSGKFHARNFARHPHKRQKDSHGTFSPLAGFPLCQADRQSQASFPWELPKAAACHARQACPATSGIAFQGHGFVQGRVPRRCANENHILPGHKPPSVLVGIEDRKPHRIDGQGHGFRLRGQQLDLVPCDQAPGRFASGSRQRGVDLGDLGPGLLPRIGDLEAHLHLFPRGHP